MPISSQPPSFPSYSNYFRSDVKSADPDIVLVSPDTLPGDIQAELILQAIGGTELIQIIRNDMVNGQSVIYKPIFNMDSFASQFSPTLITGAAPNLRGYKAKFIIQSDSLIDIQEDTSGPIYSANDSNNKPSIFVELNNITDNDIVQIALTSTTQNSMFYFKEEIDGGSYINNYQGILDGGNALGYNVDITADGGGA